MTDGPAPICLIGLPTDCNSSFAQGAAEGPAAILDALFSERGNMASELGPELGTDITYELAGDIALSDSSTDHAIIAEEACQVASLGQAPIFLGGDHSVTWPIVAGLVQVHGPITILHIDAHPDLYADFDNNPHSHASPFARIMEAGLATRLVQVGIRTLNRHCAEQAERFGVEILPMAGIDPAQVPVLDGPLYISVDLDGFDPAFAPGVAHPEPGGLTVREGLAILYKQRARIVGADIVELNPRFDINGVTAILAAKLVRELAALIIRNG